MTSYRSDDDWSLAYNDCSCEEMTFSETETALKNMIAMAPELALTSSDAKLRALAKNMINERKALREKVEESVGYLSTHGISSKQAILELPTLITKYQNIHGHLINLQEVFKKLTEQDICITKFTEDLIDDND